MKRRTGDFYSLGVSTEASHQRGQKFESWREQNILIKIYMQKQKDGLRRRKIQKRDDQIKRCMTFKSVYLNFNMVTIIAMIINHGVWIKYTISFAVRTLISHRKMYKSLEQCLHPKK